MIFVAQKSRDGVNVGVKAAAKETASPEPYVGKILQQLAKAGLLDSQKGPHGGFHLNRPAKDISLAAIVDAIDGDAIYNGCALGLERCNEERPCPLHHRFMAVRQQLSDMLQSTSLEDTTRNLEQGIGFLGQQSA